jgi:hypothetical protein
LSWDKTKTKYNKSYFQPIFARQLEGNIGNLEKYMGSARALHGEPIQLVHRTALKKLGAPREGLVASRWSIARIFGEFGFQVEAMPMGSIRSNQADYERFRCNIEIKTSDSVFDQ